MICDGGGFFTWNDMSLVSTLSLPCMHVYEKLCGNELNTMKKWLMLILDEVIIPENVAV